MANYILKLINDGIDYTKNNGKRLDSVDVEIGRPDTSTTITISSKKQLKLSLHKISFHRKVYEPGCIDATIQIELVSGDSMPTIQELQNMFMRKSVQLGAKASEQKDAKSIDIASGYYVHEVRPRYEKTSSNSMYVDLKIYSIDNLMRINKFSEAYLGRQLRDYIVTEGINDYKLKVKTFNNKESTYSIKLSTDDVLQNLSYKGGEFIQPYLVQYNETFYDFLARVCNRCGEFLYFENGKLHVGLHSDVVTDENGKKTKSKTQRSINAESYYSIAYQNITDGVISVENYAHDSLKYEKFDKTGKLENEPNYDKYNKGGYNIDQIEETGAYPETKATKIYCDEVSNNEFFMPLYYNQFAGSSGKVYGTDNLGGFIEGILMSFAEGKVADGLAHALTSAADLEIHSIMNDKKKNGAGNEIINTWAGKASKKGDIGVPFADNERHRWTTLSYYSDIKCYEEHQERKMVNVDMGNAFEDLRLGDVLKIPHDDDNSYVVVEVEMVCETIFSKTTDGKELKTYYRNMCFSAVPHKKLKKEDVKSSCWDEISDDNKNTKFKYTDNGTLKFFPPLLNTGAFRQSEPQHAIVIDSNDPKNQGRVRVRFPWQRKVEAVDDEKDRILLEAGTPWIRMVTPMATNGGGVMFRPEKGDEVMVDFENGNVERPYVVGTLYSKNVVAPEENRIIKSPNGHYIKLDDPTNSLNLLDTLFGVKFLQKWNIMPKKIDLESGSFWRKLMGGITISDALNLAQVDISAHDRKVTVKSTIGDVEVSALTGIKISAPLGDIKIEAKNIDIRASNKLTLTSGTNLYKHPLDTWHGFTKREGAKNLINRVNQFTGDIIDLSTHRHIAEIFTKPVNGTLQIKSHGFLKLEAGTGKAEIPKEQYKKLTNNEFEDLFEQFSEIEKIRGCINTLVKLCKDAHEKLSMLDEKIFKDGADNYISDITKDEFVKNAFSRTVRTMPTYRNIVIAGRSNIVTRPYEGYASKIDSAYDAIHQLYEYISRILNTLKNRYLRGLLLDMFIYYRDHDLDSSLASINNGQDLFMLLLPNIRGLTVDYNYIKNGKLKDISELDQVKIKMIENYIQRYLYLGVLVHNGIITNVSTNEQYDSYIKNWAENIAKLDELIQKNAKLEEQTQFKDALKWNLKKYIDDHGFPTDEWSEQDLWKDNFKGRILMSDDVDTISFNNTPGSGVSINATANKRYKWAAAIEPLKRYLLEVV